MPIQLTPEAAAAAREALTAALTATDPIRMTGTNARTLAINLAKQLNALTDAERARVDALDGQAGFDADVLRTCAHAVALLHAMATERQKADAQADDAKVPVGLINNAVGQRALLFKVLDYHLGADVQAAAELASIRAGSGHVDLATDLQRLADLAEAHSDALAGDRYLGDGVGQARALAKQIFGHLSAGDDDARLRLQDEQGRVLAVLDAAYAELAAAARFALRDAAVGATFESLRSISRR